MLWLLIIYMENNIYLHNIQVNSKNSTKFKYEKFQLNYRNAIKWKRKKLIRKELVQIKNIQVIHLTDNSDIDKTDKNMNSYLDELWIFKLKQRGPSHWWEIQY